MIMSVQDDSIQARTKSLHQHFLEVREMSLKITRPLSAEDQMLQSMPDASPTKWHLAHTTWFFETFILETNVSGYTPFDPRYKILFNSYYKQLGAHPNRGSRGLMSRPSLEEVHAYRAHIDDAISALLNQKDCKAEVFELVELGLNHEQQHQELILTDIKHALWSSPLPPQPMHDTNFSSEAAPLTWIAIEGGIHSVGHEGDSFAFDNECPRHDVLLRPFQIACRAVTNAEYMEFMGDGGYRRPQLWLSDGWDAVCAKGWDSPLYWERHEDGSWTYFDGAGMQRVEPAAPVCHVSYYEADAYARWSGARLPTEEEWEVTASRYPSQGTLLEDEVFHPRPAKGDGFQQAFGDVWEWTASPYVAYPGFTPADGLLGEYNGKFMCNQLVLRGGSYATPASHIRASYRNFFPAHARWQFSGIRLAK
ncbi:MAG TPA: ergothioneine biosynthesis protein EgtB [Terriglobales bacterium]|jgi:ergothioneine biosynthesis protein EgtB|nr:ergothioneine biosynthesis protein EgtB [Terriglobales bacterium]